MNSPGLMERQEGAGMVSRLSIQRAAAEKPQHPFLVFGETSLTFRQAAAIVEFLISELKLDAVNLEATGEWCDQIPVAIEGHRTVEQLIALCALFELHVPFVVLDPRWSDRERERVLCACSVHRVLKSDQIATAVGRFNGVDGKTGGQVLPRSQAGGGVVLFTSGTSGRPKGVRLSVRALAAAASASTNRLRWLADDRWLLNLPLAHVSGLSVLTRALGAGGTIVLAPQRPFAPAELVSMIEAQRITLVSVVPTMLQRIVDAHLVCPPSLRVALVGGARASVPLLTEARGLGWPCVVTYGLTEAGSQVATQDPLQAATRLTTVGPPVAGVEVRIDRDLEAGPIEIRGPSLFSGYLGEPILDSATWFATGDWGSIGADGDLLILDRRDDLLISGGENVAPAEVEAVIEQHPQVVDACVVGVDDREWGQRIAAVVRLRDHGCKVPQDFELYLREHLSAFKRPRLLRFVAQLPETAGGKLDRAACRRLFL